MGLGRGARLLVMLTMLLFVLLAVLLLVLLAVLLFVVLTGACTLFAPCSCSSCSPCSCSCAEAAERAAPQVRGYAPAVAYQAAYCPASACSSCGCEVPVTTYRPVLGLFEDQLVPYTTYHPIYTPVVTYGCGCESCGGSLRRRALPELRFLRGVRLWRLRRLRRRRHRRCRFDLCRAGAACAVVQHRDNTPAGNRERTVAVSWRGSGRLPWAGQSEFQLPERPRAAGDRFADSRSVHLKGQSGKPSTSDEIRSVPEPNVKTNSLPALPDPNSKSRDGPPGGSCWGGRGGFLPWPSVDE